MLTLVRQRATFRLTRPEVAASFAVTPCPSFALHDPQAMSTRSDLMDRFVAKAGGVRS